MAQSRSRTLAYVYYGMIAGFFLQIKASVELTG
jgi:hypothetical protein